MSDIPLQTLSNKRRPFWQVHLTTLVLLQLLFGAFLLVQFESRPLVVTTPEIGVGANMVVEAYGWPFPFKCSYPRTDEEMYRAYMKAYTFTYQKMQPIDNLDLNFGLCLNLGIAVLLLGAVGIVLEVAIRWSRP